MVFTLITIYIIFYIFILLSIFTLLFSSNLFNFINILSVGNLLLFIQKYKTSKTLYLWLFFSLTGLPPFGLFFIKFNILLYILGNTHIFSLSTVFFFLFLNMLFYCQVFSFKNHKKPLYSIVGPDIFKFFKNTTNFYSNLSSYTTYNVSIFVINILFMLIFTVFFFNDYFLILSII